MDSTAISAIGYDEEAQTLKVRFVSGGDYRYFGVPSSVAGAFLEAESKGRFFHEQVFDRYAFQRLN